MIEKALDLLLAHYVFPEKAAAAARAVRRRQAAGEYDGLTDDALAARLTADLNEVCADKHLRVRPRAAAAGPAGEEDPDTVQRERLRLANHGIARVERLDGNVGYLDLRVISDAGAGGPAVAAAMELVAHTHALIIDLRRNQGGSPNGVQLWHSYLFPDDGTHLNDIFDGETKVTRQYWTLAHVPGPRYLDRPVYVLTSEKTFSGAEEFCYNLKVLGRATLIGETTRGGAHPTRFLPLSASMEITVPFARAVNPVTGTNWEGTGVEPDVAVGADEAFDLAYERALRHVRTVVTSADVLAEAETRLEKTPRSV